MFPTIDLKLQFFYRRCSR